MHVGKIDRVVVIYGDVEVGKVTGLRLELSEVFSLLRFQLHVRQNVHLVASAKILHLLRHGTAGNKSGPNQRAGANDFPSHDLLPSLVWPVTGVPLSRGCEMQQNWE